MVYGGTWRECVDNDMKVLGVRPEWAVFGDIILYTLYIYIIYTLCSIYIIYTPFFPSQIGHFLF